MAGQADAVTPFGLAIDGDSLWVGDFTHSRVLRVDTHSRQIVAMIKVDHPSGLAIGAGAIWVAQHRQGSLVRIDPATNTVVATIALPGHVEGSFCGFCVGMIVASADGIWVPLAAGKGVVRIDPKTNTIAAFIPFKAPANYLTLGNGSVWVAEGLPDLADCKDTSETRPIECGKPPDAEHPFADADCALSAGFVARIDPATNTIVDRIAVKCPLSAIVRQGDLWIGSGGPAIYPDMVGAPAVVFRMAVHP